MRTEFGRGAFCSPCQGPVEKYKNLALRGYVWVEAPFRYPRGGWSSDSVVRRVYRPVEGEGAREVGSDGNLAEIGDPTFGHEVVERKARCLKEEVVASFGADVDFDRKRNRGRGRHDRVAETRCETAVHVARRKTKAAGLDGVIRFERADCMGLSLPADSFDAVTVAYGIRNFEDLDRGLQEMRRVLRPGGRLVIIELCTPQGGLMRRLFRFYSHVLMPAVGRLVSRDGRAYTYLPATMEAFPQGEVMQGILEKAGFRDVSFRRFTFGLSTLYTAAK